ncbi:sugar ABC transporter permease [Phytohabitans aurantiacus]|uniref:Sugar ABC transporter permease n=1 Tax=Phytohabitans aurantiacus TaxID=3016789 RepID=A0ABQ5R901_9ACTN|nr:sugar ABC transporter permease [Phytohabitans aurantiacus]
MSHSADQITAPRPSQTAAAPAPVKSQKRQGRRWLTITLFLLPALVLFGVLVLLPMLLAMYTSFFDWNGLGGRPTDFIGLENFQRLLTDDIFLGDLKRGGLLIVLSLLIQLPLSLGIAMLLNQKLRGRGFYRLLFFVPYVLSEVITGVLFTMVFSPNRGLAEHIFGWFGFDDVGSTWLSDPNTVMYSLFFVMTWKYFGFHMILYLAGRQSIPNELIEAAQVDGAGSWQAFRHVTLPLLGPTIRISIFLAVIGTIQLFDLVWVLTGGGPLHASETLAVTMFNDGFRRSDIGYASATSIVMLLISLVFALGYQRFIMRRDIEGAITVMQDKK